METKRTHSQLALLSVMYAATIAGALWMAWLVANGIGMSSDSLTYLEAASNVERGNGFIANAEPVTHYPPGYPYLIASTAYIAGMDVHEAAKLLAVICFGLNILLFAKCVARITKDTVWIVAGAILFFLASRQVMVAHAMAWSEPVFITCLLISFLLAHEYFTTGGLRFLLGAAVCIGCASLIRYVGVTIVPAFAVCILALGTGGWRKRIAHASIGIGAAVFPLLLWLARNMYVQGDATNRQLLFHPPPVDTLKSMAAEFYSVLSLPKAGFGMHLAVLCGLFIFVAGSIGVSLERNGGFREAKVPEGIVFPMVFIGTYLLGVLGSMSFVDAHTPMDSRILLPASIALLLVVSGAVFIYAIHGDGKVVSILFVAMVLVLTGSNIRSLVRLSEMIHQNGLGYASRVWNNSSTMEYVENNLRHVDIYSNGPDVIRALTRREAQMVPREVDPLSNAHRPSFREEMAAMCRKLQRGEAAIVYFKNITGRWYLPRHEGIAESCKDLCNERFADGIVLQKCIR